MIKYSIFTTKQFDNSFKKLDYSVKLQIKHWIDKHLINCDDPKAFGKPLSANKKGYWRYRIGDYRIIAEINDKRLLLIMINIGHRSKVYSN